MKPTATMLCVRATERSIAPSEHRDCATCGKKVWVTMESLKAGEGYDLKFVCEKCFVNEIPDTAVVVKEMTPGQMKEIKNALN